MNIFLLRAWLKYSACARSRHGVHSPFVYRLIDECLHGAHRHSESLPSDGLRFLRLRYTNDRILVDKLIHYFSSPNVALILNGQNEQSGDTFISFQICEVYGLSDHLANVPYCPRAELHIVCLTHIHNSAASEKQWTEAIGNGIITLSIDLFHVGLLFFSNIFMEKQHFVLRNN